MAVPRSGGAAGLLTRRALWLCAAARGARAGARRVPGVAPPAPPGGPAPGGAREKNGHADGPRPRLSFTSILLYGDPAS